MIFRRSGKNCVVKNEKWIAFPESRYVNSNPVQMPPHSNRCIIEFTSQTVQYINHPFMILPYFFLLQFQLNFLTIVCKVTWHIAYLVKHFSRKISLTESSTITSIITSLWTSKLLNLCYKNFFWPYPNTSSKYERLPWLINFF